jgi:hypothetical protein
MEDVHIEDEIIVHPIQGMQLSEGFIRKGRIKKFRGTLPGLVSCEGETKKEVLSKMELEAKEYYGEDVVVEIVPHAAA